jgi:transcriptional regulator with XRE-family HTH domain
MVRLRSSEQRQELGDFLRTKRESISPAEFGVDSGARRRTPGLRREEAAQLSGVSITWYTWIEQGRDVSASPATLARLARGLRLSGAERAYMFELAGSADPERGRGEPDDIPSAELACVDAIEAPAYILDRWWTARRWNARAARLFAGWLDGTGEHNLLRFIFLRPEARSLIGNWEERARRVAAEFRASTIAYVNDPMLRQLVDELYRESPDFAKLWSSHGVLQREGGMRAFIHPEDGFLTFRQISFTLSNWPGFKLVMLLQTKAE